MNEQKAGFERIVSPMFVLPVFLSVAKGIPV
jgi:hypothetical protein